MSPTVEDFRESSSPIPRTTESLAPGDALAVLAVDVEVDAVDAVPDVRFRR
jgi:hypothetical protein